MRITVLVEDTSGSPSLRSEHGLSLYIQTQGENILFDMGASNLFIENAEKLGLNIGDIDLAVISHGHYDHGGGLEAFLEENKKAKVYIHKKGFEGHYAKKSEKATDIGLDKDLMGHSRIILTEGVFPIDNNLMLFSEVTGNEYCSSCNQSLLTGPSDALVRDTFDHEQNLIVTENGRAILVSGCAHRGIINIIKTFIGLRLKSPDYVIGGFHLSIDGEAEDPSTVRQIGDILKNTGSKFYTGHCTGTDAYQHLKTVMGDQIRYLSPGSIIDI